MSEQPGAKPTLTRRTFLKTTGAVAGAAAVAGGTGALTALAEDCKVGQAIGENEQIFRGVCRPNCFGFCHLNVHVRDGNIVKTSRSAYKNEQYSRICHRGLSHVQRIYDPDRVKYPLRRVDGTERGAGQWERISWDEAIADIARHIKDVQGKYGEQALAYHVASGNQTLLTYMVPMRLFNILHATSISASVDAGTSYGLKRMCGASTNAWEANERTDLPNAKSIIVWGSNATDSQVQSWHFIDEARRNGTKLVVVDPIFTEIASKADEWIPIRPGADAALILSIMNEIIVRDAINTDYLKKYTVAPFLVRSDTGRFLRRSDTGISPTPTGTIDATTKKEELYNPAMVLEDGFLVSADDSVDPDLEAEYEIDGVACKTAYALLKEEVQKYPAEKAEDLTEVPRDTIKKLAGICIDGPVTHYVGYGPQAYGNGVHPTHAGMTMCALTGNIGYPGASYGSFWVAFSGFNAAFIMPTGINPSGAISILEFPDVVRDSVFRGKEHPIKMLYVFCANPLCCMADTNALKEAFDDLEYIVVVDPMMTDTACYSDLVLPATQWFEEADVTYTGETAVLAYTEKAIEPLYESKTDPEITRLLASELGLEEHFPFSDEEALDTMLTTPACQKLGITFQKLKEEKELRFLPKEPHIAFEGGSFSTPSGRLEFYLENPTPNQGSNKEITPDLIEREHLPRFYPPLEVWPDNVLREKYPLILMSKRPRYRVHSQWFNVRALRELDPEPTVEMSPSDALERGISNGDYVECYNDRGHAVARAVLSEAIRPGVMVYPKGWQAAQHKAGSWSELTHREFDPFCPNYNWMDTLVEVRVWGEGSEK